MKDNPYAKSYRNVVLDPYRIIEIYGITHPAQQHALKKLLRAGKSHKNLVQDIQEVIQSLERWIEMIHEDTPTITECCPGSSPETPPDSTTDRTRPIW
jgi:hypothetical protein